MQKSLLHTNLATLRTFESAQLIFMHGAVSFYVPVSTAGLAAEIEWLWDNGWMKRKKTTDGKGD